MADTIKNRCRLCLVAPDVLAVGQFLPRLAETLAAGDVATLIIPGSRDTTANRNKIVAASVVIAHAEGATVVLAASDRDGRPPDAGAAGADGVQLDGLGSTVAALTRRKAGSALLGLDGLSNRHDAMVAGELEPDYLFFGRTDGDTDHSIAAGTLQLARWWA